VVFSLVAIIVFDCFHLGMMEPEVIDLCESSDGTTPSPRKPSASKSLSRTQNGAGRNTCKKSPSELFGEETIFESKAKLNDEDWSDLLAPLMLGDGDGTAEPSAREKKWQENYANAKKEADNNGFSLLESGHPMYGWLTRMKLKLETYDRSPNDDDSSWALTPDKVILLRPLIETFKNRHGHRASCDHSGNRDSRGRSRSRSTSRGRQVATTDWKSFDASKFLANEDGACMNPANQKLFKGLAKMSAYRLLVVGLCRKNTGHFYTGMKWCRVAKQVQKVRCLSNAAFFYTFCTTSFKK